MTVYREYKVGGGNSPFGFLGPLLILAVFFTAMFFLAKGVFWVLSWVAPILLLITLVLDYTVVTDFFKFIWKLLKENTIMGILSVLLVVFGYPIVSGYLFFKALGKRTVKKAMANMESKQNTFTEYEEVLDEDTAFLELPPLDKKPQAQRHGNSNEYDEMFK